MQDRVPVNPGRVLVTPENGNAPYYATLTRADNPTQEGTPLNKASLLKDATAALFGLGTDAVPNDVFNVLSRFHSDLGNEYVWKKSSSVVSMGSSSAITLGTSTFNNTLLYSNSVSIQDGVLSLVNPNSTSAHALTNGSTKLSGKYFRFQSSYESYSPSTIYYVESSTTVLYVNSVYFIYAKPCSVITTDHGYVNSPNPNAYPVDDGYTYTALGQLGAKVQMATGSYVGAVQYGASNPNKLTFEFAPKLVVIVPGYTTGKGFNERLLVLPYGADYVATAFGGTNGSYIGKAPHSKVVDVSGWGSKTISWYSTDSAAAQMNESDCTYYWAAFA